MTQKSEISFPMTAERASMGGSGGFMMKATL
jgi:hypothetical protein